MLAATALLLHSMKGPALAGPGDDRSREPTIYGHRGAAGYRPEHTLAPYGRSLAPTTFIGDAHAAGLEVVAYTFRNENAFLPLELRSSADPAAYGNAIAEYRQFFELGIDGVFSDNPDTAKAARDDE